MKDKDQQLFDILEKHKDLFDKDCIEISHCPDGWIHIFEAFCDSLSAYKKSYRCKQERSLRNLILNSIAGLIDCASAIIRPRNHIVFLCKKKPNFRSRVYLRLRKLWCKVVAKKKWKQIYPPDIKIEQFKEKFGGMRIYTSQTDSRVYGMIDLAEALSLKTCEITGDNGSLCRTKASWPWYKTLSPQKAEELGYITTDKSNGI